MNPYNSKKTIDIIKFTCYNKEKIKQGRNKTMTERQEKILEELREQDKVLKEIFRRRKQIKGICIDHGDYEKIFEALFSDDKKHYDF